MTMARRRHGAAPARPDRQGDARRRPAIAWRRRPREFLALYPNARILVADETELHQGQAASLPVARGDRDLGRDHHHALGAFRFIGVPSAFEQQMIQDELELYETLLTKVESDDRVSRKRLERLKEGLKERLEALATRKDDLLTISEIGVDQIIVDEAQEFRKLSFATNMIDA